MEDKEYCPECGKLVWEKIDNKVIVYGELELGSIQKIKCHNCGFEFESSVPGFCVQPDDMVFVDIFLDDPYGYNKSILKALDDYGGRLAFTSILDITNMDIDELSQHLKKLVNRNILREVDKEYLGEHCIFELTDLGRWVVDYMINFPWFIEKGF